MQKLIGTDFVTKEQRFRDFNFKTLREFIKQEKLKTKESKKLIIKHVETATQLKPKWS